MRIRKSESKTERRKVRRGFKRALTTLFKHEFDIERMSECTTGHPGNQPSVNLSRTRRHRRVFTTVRKEYDGKPLLFIGYGLNVQREISDCGIDMGFGLKACVDIPRGNPITQYEGEMLSREQTLVIADKSKHRASHFATPVKGGPSINGFQMCTQLPVNLPKTDIYDGKLAGDPILLCFASLKGKGGGSFANHEWQEDGQCGPNAELVPDRFVKGPMRTRDETALFLVATRDIQSGEFIHVNYGRNFVKSSKSNIF